MDQQTHQISSHPSLATKVKDWLLTISLATRLLFLACVIVFFCTFSDELEVEIVSNGASNPSLDLRQPWRLFSYPFIHTQFWHIFLNIMSLIPLASHIERHIGTLPFLLLFVFLTLMSELLRVAITCLLFAANYSQPYYTSSIGISGQIFSFIVISVHRIPLSSSDSRSVFGFFVVPAIFYPWILLLIFQVFIPNVSFLGHLCGLLTGYFYCFGYLDYILPSKEQWSAIPYIGSISSLTGYITPADSAQSTFPLSIFSEFGAAIKKLFYSMKQSLTVLYYKIVGGTPTQDYIPLNLEEVSTTNGSEPISSSSATTATAATSGLFPGKGHRLGGH